MGHGDIVHVEFPVRDVDRANEYYARLFGWNAVAPPGFEDYPMWGGPTTGTGGGFAPRIRASEQPRVYVQVDSIESVLGLVVATGGTVLMAKEPVGDHVWHAAISDPDGNCIGLYEGPENLPVG